MPAPSSSRMTFALWTVCVMAAIGFAFDIYELLMLPLILAPALKELGGYLPGTPEFAHWASLLFYVPAVCGGVFGLLGGYLTDRFGRRRVLTWSILLYACSAFVSGFSTSLTILLIFRTLTFIGVCVEFVAAVAWLAELFDDPRRREKVLGYTQAFSSIGGLLVAVVNGLIVRHAMSLPAIQVPSWATPVWGSIGPNYQHADWRYTLMSGLIPAIPLIVIRPFLPESPKWSEKKAAGTLRRPSIREIFSPQLRRTTIVTTIMFACSYGVAFGAIQQLQQIVPGIDLVKAKASAAAENAPADQQKVAPGKAIRESVSNYTKSQELGGLFGRFALAMIVVHVASRRTLIRIFLIPGMVLVPLVFLAFARGEEVVFFSFDMSWLPGFHQVNVSLLGIGIFIAGFFTVAQFSFWGNYLPKAYPLHLRGTGESFAANIGGRMLGTPFAAVTQLTVASMLGQGSTPAAAAVATAQVAAAIGFILYFINLVLTTVLPEQGSADLD